MHFNRDEFALLSRNGSVPPSMRSHGSGRMTGRSDPSRRRVAPFVTRQLESMRSGARRRVSAAGAYRTGLRATWTAFGRAREDESGRH